MNLGVRAHDFGKLPPEELANEISKKGFNYIQLALPKAIPNIKGKPGYLSPGLASYIKNSFAKFDINIAVLGCYINPVNKNEEDRKNEIERFKEYIRYARSFDCNVVGTETGQYGSTLEEIRSDEAFNIMVESTKSMVAEAEKCGVFVCIEGVTIHTIYSPERMKQLIDEVNSDYLQVIFDPYNLLDETNYLEQDELIKNSFKLFGDRIVALHCKDFIIEDGKKKQVIAGEGILNYKLLFSLLKEQKPYSNILIEDVSDINTLHRSRELLLKLYKN